MGGREWRRRGSEEGRRRRPTRGRRRNSSLSCEEFKRAHSSSRARWNLWRAWRPAQLLPPGELIEISSPHHVHHLDLRSLLLFDSSSPPSLLSLSPQEICNTCSRIRNTCQCCILDLYVQHSLLSFPSLDLASSFFVDSSST